MMVRKVRLSPDAGSLGLSLRHRRRQRCADREVSGVGIAASRPSRHFCFRHKEASLLESAVFKRRAPATWLALCPVSIAPVRICRDMPWQRNLPECHPASVRDTSSSFFFTVPISASAVAADVLYGRGLAVSNKGSGLADCQGSAAVLSHKPARSRMRSGNLIASFGDRLMLLNNYQVGTASRK